mgnify:CR=1 FL=1
MQSDRHGMIVLYFQETLRKYQNSQLMLERKVDATNDAFKETFRWIILLKNWFLEEYLIYFKSELMLNSKLSPLPKWLIEPHLAFTRKCSGVSEMVICVKVFCFRPNWTLHNEIMLADFIYNIFHKHQNVKILDIFKIEPTPLLNIGLDSNDFSLVSFQSFHLILNSQTDLQYLIAQFFLGWC